MHQERRAKDVPIYIGATGMQMMELTGELADGAVLNYLVSPAYNLDAIAALRTRRGEGGPHASTDIDRPQLVVCSVDRDRAAALDGARLLVTQYLGQQPHIMKASGVPQELLDEIGKVLTWPATHDQVVAASKLVPDDIVQMITASGEPDEVRAKVARVRGQRVHVPDPVPARRRRAADDRHLRRRPSASGLVAAAQRARCASPAPYDLAVRISRARTASVATPGDPQVISIRPVLALSLAGALVLVGMWRHDDEATADESSVVTRRSTSVGRTIPISQLMAEIYGQGLENAGYRVGRKDPVADQAAAFAKLESGSVQFDPRVHRSLLDYLAPRCTPPRRRPVATDATEQMTRAPRGRCPTRSPRSSRSAIDNDARSSRAAPAAIEEFSLATIGDLAGVDAATLGGTADFADATSGGLAALNEAYDAELTVTPTDDVAAAVADGTVDCGVLPGARPGDHRRRT